jgi:hypothetical protein
MISFDSSPQRAFSATLRNFRHKARQAAAAWMNALERYATYANTTLVPNFARWLRLHIPEASPCGQMSLRFRF